jgi:hypothetical protein
MYFVRVFPDGKASLSRGSQWIGECSAGTFDFSQLYTEISSLPAGTDHHTKFHYDAQFLERDKQYQDPAGRQIKNIAIAKTILEKFEAAPAFGALNVQKLFVQTPPFPENS